MYYLQSNQSKNEKNKPIKDKINDNKRKPSQRSTYYLTLLEQGLSSAVGSDLVAIRELDCPRKLSVKRGETQGWREEKGE